jgi:cysteinyl-tRNA synthetase
LLFENRKMSKSLGNFEPLSELLQRHDPQAIRLLFLQTSYSKVMNFTEESVSAAAATLARLKEAYRTLRASGAPQPTDLRRTGLISDVEAALDEDMNTAVAFSKVFQFATSLKPSATPDDAASQQALYELIYALGLLGIEPNASWDDLPAVALPADLAARLREQLAEVTFNGATPEEAIDLVIAARRQARERKDFQQSDRLRDALLACGIVLADSKEGTTWSVAAAP